MTGVDDGWVDACLAAHGRARTGPTVPVRDRPWSTVWTVPTDAGTIWVKRPGAAVRFEVPLLSALADLRPRLTPEVLGAGDDVVVLADAGTTYRDLFDDDARSAALTDALVATGALQRAAAPLVPGLLSAGVADLRPAALPARFDELVGTVGPVDGATPARARLVELCAELSGSAVPASVDHNDLHDGNVLRDAAGRTVVLDWGDAVVAHPFATLLVPARVLAGLAGADHEAPWAVPAVAAARRAYLAGFADLAPGEDLDRTAWIAFVVAHVARAWVWRRAMTTFEPGAMIGDRTAAEFADGAWEWFALAVRVLRAA